MSTKPELPELPNISLFQIPELDVAALEAHLPQMYQDDAKNPNAFSNWFHAVVAEDIKHPATLTLALSQELQDMLVNQLPPTGDLVTQVDALEAQVDAFGQQHGFPLFIKSSYTSDKHGWVYTCCLEDAVRAKLLDQVFEILQFQVMFSPHRYTPELVVREMIETTPVFHAFSGMPITEEYRMFADAGRAIGYQPYWPASAFENLEVEGWAASLASISTPSAQDLAYMTQASERITKRLGGYWSVDFLKDKDGQLWLIDMAEGGKSFKCEVGYKKIAPPQPHPEP